MIGHKRIPSREGGVEVVVEQLASRMVALHIDVDVYNRKGRHVSGEEYSEQTGDRLLYKGIRIITIPTLQNGSLNALVYSILASLRALWGQYDIIHFHAEGSCAMLWLPRLFGIRTVATIHGLDWQRAKWGAFASKYLKFGEKLAAKYADEVIVLSSNVKEYFKQNYGIEACHIPNGVEKPNLISDKIINQKYSLCKNQYILFLGRIVPEKGLVYLINAFKEIRTDKKLVIAGGSSHSNSFVNELKSLAKTDDRIVLTGFVQGETLESLYSNAYFYVLPSDLEGMPLSLLEAMSYGNCCLTSDIRENTEVVEGNALTFIRGDTTDLCLKMNQLLEYPEIVDKFKACSQEYICKKYNWNDIVHKTILLYEGKAELL